MKPAIMVFSKAVNLAYTKYGAVSINMISAITVKRNLKMYQNAEVKCTTS